MSSKVLLLGRLYDKHLYGHRIMMEQNIERLRERESTQKMIGSVWQCRCRSGTRQRSWWCGGDAAVPPGRRALFA